MARKPPSAADDDESDRSNIIPLHLGIAVPGEPKPKPRRFDPSNPFKDFPRGTPKRRFTSDVLAELIDEGDGPWA